MHHIIIIIIMSMLSLFLLSWLKEIVLFLGQSIGFHRAKIVLLSNYKKVLPTLIWVYIYATYLFKCLIFKS